MIHLSYNHPEFEMVLKGTNFVCCSLNASVLVQGIHVEGNKTSSVPLQMPVEMISGHVSEGKPTRNYDVGSAQNGEKSSSDGEVSIGKKGHQRKRYYAPVEVQSVTT